MKFRNALFSSASFLIGKLVSLLSFWEAHCCNVVLECKLLLWHVCCIHLILLKRRVKSVFRALTIHKAQSCNKTFHSFPERNCFREAPPPNMLSLEAFRSQFCVASVKDFSITESGTQDKKRPGKMSPQEMFYYDSQSLNCWMCLGNQFHSASPGKMQAYVVWIGWIFPFCILILGQYLKDGHLKVTGLSCLCIVSSKQYWCFRTGSFLTWQSPTVPATKLEKISHNYPHHHN